MVALQRFRRSFLFLFILHLAAPAFADSKSVEPTSVAAACSGGPECIVVAGLLLVMSGIKIKPAIAQKMDSVSDSLIIFCEQAGAVPEMSFPCGPTELELFEGPQKQALLFRGGKIVIPKLVSDSEMSVILRARGCKESQTISPLKAGDVIRIRLSADCTKEANP